MLGSLASPFQLSAILTGKINIYDVYGEYRGGDSCEILARLATGRSARMLKGCRRPMLIRQPVVLAAAGAAPLGCSSVEERHIRKMHMTTAPDSACFWIELTGKLFG